MDRHKQQNHASFLRHRFPAGFSFRIIAALICAGITLSSPVFAAPEEIAPGRAMAQQAAKGQAFWITSDHSEHEILQQAFTSGPEVTQACLSCHNLAALQFHKSIHWTWMDPHTEKSARFGKGGLSINNF